MTDERDEQDPAEQPTAHLPVEEFPGGDDAGTSIGPYTLVKKLGEGGMGTVWLAKQSEPVRREVALKLIRHGHDIQEVVARFESERQALALMDHPAIAKVLDAGSTPDGVPYFVMEYVRGVPIARYCDDARLSTRDRIELLALVCEGVQHAHQKAMIHRDLKPSNVLVAEADGKPVPKIIDFGVAKALEQKLTDHTMHTRAGVMIGTPAYMSPEQASGETDIDTRTDVYALGVILYELLTGVLPFDPATLGKGGIQELCRILRDVEPPRPSTRISTVAETASQVALRRRTEPGRLAGRLRGDLDWITLRALEKDRARRYPSPMALADDLRRHLRHEPVDAGPPSLRYRAGKFVRRNRGLVIGTAATGIALIAGIVTSINFALEAGRERDKAQRVARFQSELLENLRVSEMGEDLMQDLRRQAEDPGRFDQAVAGINPTDVARGVLRRNLLLPADETVGQEFSDQPDLEAAMRLTLGRIAHSLDLLDEAHAQTRRSWELARTAHGESSREALEAQHLLGRVLHFQEQPDEATRILEGGLALSHDALGPEAPLTLEFATSLARVHVVNGRPEQAVPLLNEVVRIRLAEGQPQDEALWRARYNLAHVYSRMRDYENAALHFAGTVETARPLMASDPRFYYEPLAYLGSMNRNRGRYADAESALVEALAGFRENDGVEDYGTLNFGRTLFDVYMRTGQFEPARALVEELLPASLHARGPEDLVTLALESDLCEVDRREQRIDSSEAYQRQTELYRRAVDTAGTRSTGFYHLRLGRIDALEGREAQAIENLRAAVELGFQPLGMLDGSEWARLAGTPEFEALAEQVRDYWSAGTE